MAPNLERATLPVPIFLRSSPDCLRSCFILTTLSPRKSRMWMFDVVSNVQRLPCSKESINKKYLLDYYETQLWFHYFKKVWCNSRNSNQSCKTDFALPESQRFRLLEWTWCVCVCGGGAASSWEVQRRELWTFSLLKEFLPRQQYKTINFESDQNLQFVIENTCSWDWAELLLPNCVWQEWISTELQSIPDFMASLSIGVLISRFYVGGFLVIH